MNILIYTQKSSYLSFSVGGAETSLRMLAEKLAAEGHTVVYLTEMKWGRFPRHRKEIINGVHVHFVGFPDLPSKGVNILLKLRAKIAEYSFYKKAENLIKKYEIDIVHTYHEIPAMYRFLKLREKKQLDYVTVLRNGGKFWVEKLKIYPRMFNHYKYVFNNVDSVNFNTPGMKGLFDEACRKVKMDVSLKDHLVQDIGLDFSRMGKSWELPQNKPFTMVMASRFSPHQKRQKLLVEAVSLLPENFPCRLILIGDGPEQLSAQKLIREKRIEDKVEIRSYMDQQELWDLMAQAHLYVHGCDFEGLSKIIIEAMAMGIPVLASDVTPLNDYLVDGENGFLVENEAGAWARRMQAVLEDQQQLEKISVNARNFIEDHYQAEKNVKRYQNYFERLRNHKNEAKRAQ